MICGGVGAGVGHLATEGGAPGVALSPPDCCPVPSRWLKLPPLLSSSNVALRILAGETIALVFELAQDVEVWWALWWQEAVGGWAAEWQGAVDTGTLPVPWLSWH